MPETPLSQRVPVPIQPSRPVDRDGLAWRPATVDDIDAIHDCVRAMDAVDHPHYVTTREEVEEDFEHSYVDVALDSMLAVEPTGRVVAWGMSVLSPGQDTLVRAILFGGVRPDSRGRGIGRELLAWQQDRGLQQLASSPKTLPGWLVTFAQESSKDAASLYTRFGLRLERYFLELTRDLSEPIVDVALDPELRLEPFTPAWSDRTLAGRNDSFRDHWGSQPLTDEQWNSFVNRSVTRPDLSFLAIGTTESGEEQVAGLVMSSVNEEDWELQGYSSAYIDLVGVGRAWRNRGVAKALLTVALRAIADAGLERAVLDVDLDSPTGALKLYTGVGFTELNRSVCYIREF